MKRSQVLTKHLNKYPHLYITKRGTRWVWTVMPENHLLSTSSVEEKHNQRLMACIVADTLTTRLRNREFDKLLMEHNLQTP